MIASIIMPTYNKASFLARTLASYLNQTSRSYELIVVDDGSADTTPSVLERFARRLPLQIHRHDNQGRAISRNQAIALARGDVLIFSDDDRIVPPTFVECHLAAHATGASPRFVIGPAYGLFTDLHPGLARHPEAARAIARNTTTLVTEADVEHDFANAVAAHGFVEPTWKALSTEPLQSHGADISDLAIAWYLVYTGNLSLPRDALARVGGFDGDFRTWGFEDTELGYRLGRGELSGYIELACPSYHQWHPRDFNVASISANANRFRHKHRVFEVELFMEWLSCLWGEGTPMPFSAMNALVVLARSNPATDQALTQLLGHGRGDPIERMVRSFERTGL